MSGSKTPWGGRFEKSPGAFLTEFGASLPVDKRMWAEDIRGSIAHARMLAQQGVITEKDADAIEQGLSEIFREIKAGGFEWRLADEDVHMAIERVLTERIGPAGARLHTARSRNDQVATDFSLWLQASLKQVEAQVKNVQSALVRRAEQDMGQLINGYTHVQRSQPLLLSHWWLSHFWPLQRDRQRLAQLRERASVLPLGSGALAGTSFPIDRQFLANQLGLKTLSPNSLDAVSNRDHAAEFLFIASLISVHLSQLAESLILYASSEFGYIELSDAYSTGSSLMPQKKNPDTLELTRGKTGTIIGRLTGLLTTLKGLPSSYNKDLQEDKIPVFETFDTLNMMLPVVAGVLNTLTVQKERLKAALDPNILATDLADYLVQKGIPFRDAHGIVGKIVRRAAEQKMSIDQLPLSELQAIHPVFAEDVASVFDFQASVARREVPGATGPKAVQIQLQQAKSLLV